MADLIERIVNAIIRQEGQSPTALNPGDIRDPVWFPGQPPVTVNGVVTSHRKYFDGSLVMYKPQGAIQSFWVPRSRAEGLAGIYCQVAIHVREGDSVTDFIGGSAHYQGYAPSSDNNKTDIYIRNVCAWAEIPDAKAPMWNYLEQIPT